ncbi:hypothetical protein AAFF_G00107730 [Aldrovandia affinis]|uniref:Uncharacterized protein n=1 Tax=Aldrovandia affinis TaxID=143900 RepID=A0AAD7RU04_9TELE|nr:hypothetical protein AAFF_G00107730 [Aldrovandia affinis]
MLRLLRASPACFPRWTTPQSHRAGTALLASPRPPSPPAGTDVQSDVCAGPLAHPGWSVSRGTCAGSRLTRSVTGVRGGPTLRLHLDLRCPSETWPVRYCVRGAGGRAKANTTHLDANP